MDDLTGPRPDEDRDPRPATSRLVRAIGARLRSPLPAARRDALVTELAAAARDGSGDELAVRRAARALRSRRFAAAAAALVVVGGAVGVVTRGDDLPVIVLADGASASGAPMVDAAGGAEAMRGDAMIGWWTPTIHRFVAADGLDVPAPRAAAWRMAAPADLGAAAGRLAAELGLASPAPSEWDPRSLFVQQDDGASLWVSASGDWYFGGPSDLFPVWDCPEPDLARDEREPVECTPPAAPVDVPTEERARTLALAFLAQVGHGDVRILDVMVDEWGAYVQGELVLPGSSASSGVYVGVGFAGGERISWANGTLARPEAIGDYPLIGLAAALERLERDMNAWLEDGVMPMPMPRPLPADEGDGGVVTDVAPADDADAPTSDRDAPTSDAPGSDGDGPVSILPLPEVTEPGVAEPGVAEPGVIEPGGPGMPGDDMPWEDIEPVERTVRIVSVELVTSVVWAEGDVIVLLPHYRLIDSEGGWWFVIAVEDRYVQR